MSPAQRDCGCLRGESCPECNARVKALLQSRKEIPMASDRQCYNCGPRTPQAFDEKWLCERCRTIFDFDGDRMIYRVDTPVHRNIHGQPFTDEDLRNAGQDWGDPTLSEKLKGLLIHYHPNTEFVQVPTAMLKAAAQVCKAAEDWHAGQREAIEADRIGQTSPEFDARWSAAYRKIAKAEQALLAAVDAAVLAGGTPR